ncbi:hypothetical protein BYT27DRAFT_7103600, partial [Phlegmacium glaucopus]
ASDSHSARCEISVTTSTLTSTAPIPTQKIPAQTVFHEAQAAIRPLISGIQTQEQLDELIGSLQDIQ